MKVLHVLASSSYSGAENVACQIIKMFEGEADMCYCSPNGPIADSLKEKNIELFPLKKLSIKEIKKAIKFYKPDVLHCHDLKATILCSRFKNLVKISHIHGNKSNMSKLSVKSLLYYMCAKKFDKIFWVSKSCFEDFKFKSKLQQKSIILPNIISIEHLKNLVNSDKNNYNYDIVYLGRLVYEKNPTRLIEIANLLKTKLPHFKMAIVGDGQYKEQLLDLIKQSNLKDNVFCLGFNSNPYKILSCAKTMLMTSIMEGTPMCAVESMSLGVPVVSTKTDGMVQLVKQGENGFLYDTNEEAANYILNIINNEYKNLSKTTIDFAQKYNDIKEYKINILTSYKNKN